MSSSVPVMASVPFDFALDPKKQTVSTSTIAISSLTPLVSVLGDPNAFELSYLIRSSPSVMINSVDFSEDLAVNIEAALDGMHPAYMVITHGHDTKDHDRWKARFPNLERVIHEADVSTGAEWPGVDTQDIETKLAASAFQSPSEGRLGRWTLAPGIHVLSTPGHTPGSVCVLAEESATGGQRVLFSGDHLTARPDMGRLDGSARFGKDIVTQAKTIRELASETFTVLAPGHGPRVHFDSPDACSREMTRAGHEFAEDPYRRRVSHT